MPSLYTHYLLGDKVFNLIKRREIKDSISKYRQVFNLGTQGPDILFYYRPWPWTNNRGVNKIGEKIHSENVKSFFSNAIDYITNRHGDERELLAAYLYGYACHYSLDSHTHPYVFYKTGFVRKGEKPTEKYTCYHRLFEFAIDVIILDKFMNKRPPDIKAHELIKVKHPESLEIGKLYEYVLKNTFRISLSSEQVQTSINDMTTALILLRDKTGLKRKLIYWAETKLGKYPLYASAIYPLKVKDGLDYMNSKHSTWCFPWDNTSCNTSSFYDMFDVSAKKAVELCEVIFDYIYGNKNKESTLNLIGNRSFASGQDASQPLEFKYFDCIFK